MKDFYKVAPPEPPFESDNLFADFVWWFSKLFK